MCVDVCVYCYYYKIWCLNMLKCGYLVDCWVCDDRDSGWGGRIMQSLHLFSSFSGSN